MTLSTIHPILRPMFYPTTSRFERICSVEAEGGGDAGGAGGGGNAAGGAGGGAPGAGAGEAAKAWYEGLASEGLRTSPSLQNFKTVDDLASGYVNLEKRFGIDPARRLDLPADPKDAAAMRAVFTKLGLPEKPEGYGFSLAEGASDADKAFLGRATAALHEIGLPSAQAEGVFQYWMKESAAANEAAQLQAQQARDAGMAALKKEWGGDFDRRAREIGAMMNRYGAPDLAKELDSGEKLGNHPQLALFLGHVLDAVAEDGAAGGESGDAAGSDRRLTPSQAIAEAKRIEAHPGFRDKNHPQHKALVEERQRFLLTTA
ncbi:MAG: hypothetical protein ACREEW_01375 [Caulobacteraceae bacterium]